MILRCANLSHPSGSEIEAEEIFGVDATSASAVQSPLDIEMSESEQVMENAAKITRDQVSP